MVLASSPTQSSPLRPSIPSWLLLGSAQRPASSLICCLIFKSCFSHTTTSISECGPTSVKLRLTSLRAAFIPTTFVKSVTRRNGYALWVLAASSSPAASHSSASSSSTGGNPFRSTLPSLTLPIPFNSTSPARQLSTGLRAVLLVSIRVCGLDGR